MEVAAAEAYRLLSGCYDQTPNPLLALEMRILSVRLGPIEGLRIIDAGSGTGRWMAWTHSRGARVFGLDASREMLLEAARKPGLAGRSARADLRQIPFRDDAADLVICSFALGYLPSIRPVIRELARIAPCIVLSDLHPATGRHGWTRSFRSGGEIYEVKHFEHPVAELDEAARTEGLTPLWRAEPRFGEPERDIFRSAGKEEAFQSVSGIPAVLVTAWTRQSH